MILSQNNKILEFGGKVLDFDLPLGLVTSGIILWLDASNTSSYPGTGTAWTDLSGLNNNGTLVNGPTFNSDNGGSIVFDGTNDRVLITPTSQINSIQVPMTIMGWFYDVGTRTQPTLFSQYQNTTVGNLVKLVRPQSGVMKYFASLNTAPGFQEFTMTGGVSYTLNTWNFYSITISGTLASSTLNITLNTTTQTFSVGQMATPNTAVEVRLGMPQNINPNEPLAGRIGSTYVYNRALTPAEVLQNYNATKTRFGY